MARIEPEHIVRLARRAGSTPDDSIALEAGDDPMAPQRSVASDPIVRYVADALRFYFEFHQRYDGFYGAFIHDPLAVAATLDRALVETDALFVDVETRGEITTGMTVARPPEAHRPAPEPRCGEERGRRDIPRSAHRTSRRAGGGPGERGTLGAEGSATHRGVRMRGSGGTHTMGFSWGRFDTRTIVLIPIAIAINIVLGQTVGSVLKIPIYLDSIGTILVGVLGGPDPRARHRAAHQPDLDLRAATTAAVGLRRAVRHRGGRDRLPCRCLRADRLLPQPAERQLGTHRPGRPAGGRRPWRDRLLRLPPVLCRRGLHVLRRHVHGVAVLRRPRLRDRDRDHRRDRRAARAALRASRCRGRLRRHRRADRAASSRRSSRRRSLPSCSAA